MAERRRLSDQEIGNICDQEIRQALAYSGNKLSDQRSNAMRYYLGEKVGPLQKREGRSSVVSRDVMETVEWMMPALIRMFTSGDNYVEYQPRNPGEEDAAQQQTDYINWVFDKDNDGFLVLYTWFKDGLIQKNGFVKYWWDVRSKVRTQVLGPMDEVGLAMLVEEVGGANIVETTVDEVPMLDPFTGQPVLEAETGRPATMPFYTVKVSEKVEVGRVAIKNVPPEHMLVSKWTVKLEDSPFVAETSYPSRTELVEMGFPKAVVWELPASRRRDGDTSEDDARFDYDDSDPDSSTNTSEKSMEHILLYECYIRIDRDGDGEAELLKVLYSGNTVLDVEETDHIPFADLTPIPMPHKLFGLSIADLMHDIQEIRSSILRASLDNMYQSVNVRVEVPEDAMGDHTLDDLANNVPGGWVRTRGQGGLSQLPVQPILQGAFSMLEAMNQERETRSGVTSETQGVAVGSLNQAGVAVDMRQQAANQRIELVGRIFADTGVKKLFADLPKIARRYEGKRLLPNPRFDDRAVDMDASVGPMPQGQRFIEVDPSMWPEEMDVKTEVGPGTGTKQTHAAMLQGVLAHQKELRASGDPELAAIATPQDIYEASLSLVETVGLRNGSKFFTNPQVAQQQMAEAAEAQAAQQQAMMEQMAAMQAQMQQMLIMTKAQADMMEAEQGHRHDVELEDVKSRNKLMLQNDEQAADAMKEGFRAGSAR